MREANLQTSQCVACGELRPQAQLAVHDGALWLPGQPTPVDVYVRYCWDRPACVTGALTYARERALQEAGRRQIWGRAAQRSA
jgi:hypothetical protein